jgi:hypothetical protein
MAAEQLQIQVQANVSNAVNNLNNLNKSLSATNSAAVQTGTTGMGTLSKGTKQATFALTNFSRVASDAPFGLIGIGNNIDPLVQSFVSLRKETGSTGGALKALGASLAGGGGLILGISLVTSALQFAQLGFSRWGASAKKAKEDGDKLKQGQEQLIETTTKQRLEFETLVKITKDATQTDLARNQALKKLNEILPDTIGKLNQQNIATAQGEEIIRSYIKAVEAKATAELLSGRIAANNVQIFDLQQNSLKEISELNKDIERNTRLRKSLEGSGRLEQEAITQKKISDGQKDIVKVQKDTQIEIEKINKLNETLRAEYEKQIPLVNTLNDKKENTNKKLTKEETLQEKINTLLKDYKQEISGIRYEGQIKGLNVSNQLLETNLNFLVRAAKLVGQTGQAYKTINADTQRFANAASNQKIVEVITAYQTALSELDIKQAITGQDQLNARINAATDALVKLKTLGVQDTNEEFIKLQNTLNSLQAEVGLREIRKRTEKITKTWEKFQLQINKLNFNQTKKPLDVLKSKIDLIGNTIQDLKSKGLTDKDLGIQILSLQFEGLNNQFTNLSQQLEVFKQFQSILEQGLGGAVDNLFNAVANGENVFEALKQSVKDLVIELGKAVVKSLILKAITSAIAPGAGAAAGGAVGGSFMRSDFIFAALGRGSQQSDKRLKKNIKFIGVSKSGINIYEFEYLHKDGKYIGVIAQELLNTKFESALKYINNFYEVDYSLIDVEFKKIA